MPRPRSRRSRSDSRPPAEQTFACRHFGICGGCSLLDQPIAWQLHDKLERCRELLAPFLNGCEIEHGLPRRPQQHFRTRLLYPVRQDKDRQPVLGIYEYQSHHVVRIDECRTQDRWLTELGRRIEPILKELRIEGFHAGRRRGIAKAFWARLMSGTGEVLAGLVTRPGAFDQGSAFADALMAATTDMPRTARGRRLVGVMHSISDRTDGFLLGDRHVPLRGRDYVTDERDGLTFRVSAGSFYQIHAGAHALLYRPAMAMCGDLRDRRVVDGYGGVGAFGLRAAKAGAKDVLVVEDNASSCRDAEHNKRLNELPQVAVQRAPFADADLPDDIDLLIVDPPRAGLQRRGVERALAARP
ncbi:MAG TPA: class I SAM-dependent RNA methyltransferase, partial [bacterium]|nr:class I SAM-dependent RNA methyltransferase [bacterium]